jgi:hypothetical protein
VALLLIRPRVGLPATVAVIATNVIHNLAATACYAPSGEFLDHLASSWQMVSQIGFLLFVIATWRIAARGTHRANFFPSDQAAG